MHSGKQLQLPHNFVIESADIYRTNYFESLILNSDLLRFKKGLRNSCKLLGFVEEGVMPTVFHHYQR